MIYGVERLVCSLPYQVSVGMDNLTVNKTARCFCTCREDGKEANGVNILPKCYMCRALHNRINLIELNGDWPQWCVLQNGDLNLYVLSKTGEKQGLHCVALK